MKKIVCLLFLLLNSFAFAIDDIVDKDNLHNLIEGVNSTRFGSDRIISIYDFSPLINHNTPFKLGVSLLDLSHIVDNSENIDGSRKLAFLPKAFVGLTYGIFAFGYQFNLYNDLKIKNSTIAHSHSISFGFANEKYRFTIPLSFLAANEEYYQARLSISTTPQFTFLFRNGFVDEFTISLHYGVQLSKVTNSVGNAGVAPMVIGGSLYANVMLTRFDNYPLQISMPLKAAFYYGIGSRWASIDAGYAVDALKNYLYSDENQTERSTDSIRFYIVAPVKFEAKLGAIYTYIMPRLIFEGNVYKTDGEYNLHYGMEGELQFTLVENLTFGLTGYIKGQGIMKQEADYNINTSFGGGIDLWGTWRY